jgi:hypothetical protein
MSLRVLVIITGATLLLATACSQQPQRGSDVLDQDMSGWVVFATTECVEQTSDGKACNKRTCKKDDKSDCMELATNCLQNGHKYQGTSEAGTCSRVNPL